MNLLLRHPGRVLAVYWTITVALVVALFASEAPGNVVAPASRSVTLLTGQVVHLGPGSVPLPQTGMIEQRSPDAQSGTIEYPAQLALPAHPYLDPELFDAAYLEQQGFGDDASRTVNVLVMFDNRSDAIAAMHAGVVDGGIRLTHLFEYLPMAVGYVQKHGPYVPTAPESLSSGVAKHDVAAIIGAHWSISAPDLNAANSTDSNGVTGIYLDDKVTLPAGDAGTAADAGPALNDAVKLIGADVAHERGITGTGVKIAVVDTGIDSSHPDLSGKVVTARNFSSDSDSLDHFGHGTHVASIAAGTGAASNGTYEGVAPGAELINAKALSQYGSGTNAQIIEAMEWAADQGAKVVNMSLGGQQSDGRDPMSAAVNAISKAKGVLFVIAAGNAGPRNKVSTPAAADDSLAVAAIDKSRTLATFSSRGPRLSNMALKPDISAPGVAIKAARANHGSDDPYVAFSGTSMASPMVAGSAALVWQLHPTWSRQQVKDALLTSAAPIGGACEVSAFDQGAGAVNLAGILDQTVTTDPGSVSFGIVKTSAKQELALQNLTDQPMTVSLSASLCQTGNPDGTVQVEPSQVTIPAGTSSQGQTITVSLSGFKKSGTFTGAVTEESQGKLVARQALGVVVK